MRHPAGSMLTGVLPILLLIGSSYAQFPQPAQRRAVTLPNRTRTPLPPIMFEEVAADLGITWEIGEFGGAGGAFLDYDGDGWQDILLVGGNAPPALYRNLGEAGFVDVTAAAGLDRPPEHLEWYMCATVADYDSPNDLPSERGPVGRPAHNVKLVTARG